jgi:integrator complex subunit 2
LILLRDSIFPSVSDVKKRTYSFESDNLMEWTYPNKAPWSTPTMPLSPPNYLLLYEDFRLSNTVNIIQNNRKVKSYSTEFMSELPIKYLLQQAQRNQHDYSGIYSPLLRLLVTYFPHLSLIDDWIEEETITYKHYYNFVITELNVIEAFEEIELCPSKVIRLLKKMMTKSQTDLWPLAKIFIQYFKKILGNSEPRLVQKLYRLVWTRLNTILPRRLWAMSINALMMEDEKIKNLFLTHEKTQIDSLQDLRCDERVFRCADALMIVLRILQANLAASKSQLSRHIFDKPLLEKTGQLHNENEQEELKLALVASQESVAVQILLEACLESAEDRALREVRGMICSYIHHVFIAESSLAELVLFQGYPREPLSMTVRGIPPMHICLDFIPELLSMAEMNKQIFAINLTSHLSLQYALPKSLCVAKLCLNTLTTLLSGMLCFA